MPEVIRRVRVQGSEVGYLLTLTDTGTTTREGKSRLGYTFVRETDGLVIFEGDDFGCSPLHAVDSDDTVRALLSFLTLQPGDTDAEYFEAYTADQHAFAAGDAETVSALYCWDDDAEEATPFEEVDLEPFPGYDANVAAGLPPDGDTGEEAAIL